LNNTRITQQNQMKCWWKFHDWHLTHCDGITCTWGMWEIESKKLEWKMKTKFIQHSNVGIYYVQNIRYAKIRVPKGKVFMLKMLKCGIY